MSPLLILQLLERISTNTFFSLSPRSVWWIRNHKLGNEYLCWSYSCIYRLFSADAYHNSKSKTKLDFSTCDSSTMEGLNHQSTKLNGSELNCEDFISVGLGKKGNLCYTVLSLIQNTILNSGDLLTLPWISTTKLKITDTRRIAAGVDRFQRWPWDSAEIPTWLQNKASPKATCAFQSAASIAVTVKIIVLCERSWVS